MNLNSNALKEFVDALKVMTGRQFSKELNTANVEYAFKGIVTAVSDDAATASVDMGDSIIEDIPNLTGYPDLKTGDTVKVFSDRRNMVGAYIGVKIASYIETTSE